MAKKSELVIEFKVINAEFQKAMKEMGSEVTALNKEFKLEQEQLRLNGTEKDKLQSKMNYLNDRYKLQQKEVESTRVQLEKAKEVYGENSKEVKELENKLTDAQRKEQYFANEIKLTNEKLSDQSDKAKQVGKSLEEAGEKMQNAGKKMTGVGKEMSTKLTVPIMAVGTLSAKSAIEFESAFAGVRKTVDASESDFKKLETGIRDMAKEIPASATAIAGVAEAAGQLGIETPNILSFTRVMIDLGESTNMSADEAATALARLANITGMSQNDFGKLGSVIVALGNKFATTESEITNMGLRLAGAGSQIGLTEAETMSFAAALSSVGIEAEAGGSAFSKLMVNMQLSVEKGGKGLNDFAKVAGMSASDFQKSFKEDATGAILAFIEGLSTSEERGISAIKVLDDMGIKEVRLRDTLLKAAGASDVFSEAVKIGSEAWDENVALTNEANQRYETTASKLEVAKNHLTDAAITIGEIVVPYIVELSEKVKEASEWFGNLDESTQETIVKFAGFVAVAGPVLMAVGSIASGVGALTSGAGLLIGKLGLASAAMGTVGTATATAGTAAATAGGIGGLGALGAGLGGVVLAAAPYLAVGAGIAAIGYGIHKNLQEEVVPSVDLFADKVESTAVQTEDAWGRVSQRFEETTIEISEATEQAVGAYLKLDEEAQNSLNSLYINSTTITAETKAALETMYSEMATNITTSQSQKRDEDLANLQQYFENNKTLSTEEQEEILNNTKLHHDEAILATEQHKEAIKGILQKASDENRALTKSEREEINRIQNEMKTTAVKTLSDQEVEAKVILERMKSHDTRITAEQASEHIKTLNKSRDDSIKAANTEYDKRIATIIRLRDEAGVISADQADKLIKDAEKTRDDTITAAEETRDGAVSKMKSMNKDLEGQVDTSSGKILTKWDKLKNWWNSWKPGSKSFETTTTNTVRNQVVNGKKVGTNAKGTDFWRGGLTWVGEEGPELVDLQRGAKVYSNPKSLSVIDKLRELPESFANAQLAPTGNTTINFNGKYQFRDEEDINYFMNRAELLLKRRGK